MKLNNKGFVFFVVLLEGAVLAMGAGAAYLGYKHVKKVAAPTVQAVAAVPVAMIGK